MDLRGRDFLAEKDFTARGTHLTCLIWLPRSKANDETEPNAHGWLVAASR